MSIGKRPNGSYEVRYRDGSGRNRSKSFRTLSQARIFERKVKESLSHGTWNNPDFGKITLNEVNALFVKSKSHLKSHSKISLDSIWKCHIEPTFGARRVSSISFNDIQDWVFSSLGNSVSPDRITRAQVQLAQILDFAVDRGYLPRNPARKSNGTISKITYSKSYVARPKIALELKELISLAENCGQYKTLILLTGTIGLRWAEVVGLQVQDIDFVNSRVQILRTLNEVRGVFEESTPKSNYSRTISIPGFLVPLLKVIVDGKSETDLVFSAPSGSPLRSSNFKRDVFEKGIKYSDIPRITFHELRHTAASNAILLGGTIEEVANMLGHQDKSLTLRVYSHMFSSSERNLALRINENFQLQFNKS